MARAARIAGQCGLFQSHRGMEIAMCCHAFVAPSCFEQYERRGGLAFRKDVINLRGLVSRTNSEGAEVESVVYECVCGDAPVC